MSMRLLLRRSCVWPALCAWLSLQLAPAVPLCVRADEPTEGGAAPGGRDSGWLEVRPGEVSLELVGTQAEEEQH
jgi:hypothetical protein